MKVDGAVHAREGRGVDDAFDFVVVGSGAAGATAARVLADAGARVAVVEEGPAVETKQFGDRVYPAFRRMFRGIGSLVARGRAIVPIIQGRCLGGSTVINSAIMWRIPEDVWLPWKTDHGLGDALPLDALEARWDRIERDLAVVPVAPAVQGENNRLMEVAARRLGVSAHPIRRAERGCRGSARCFTGCPHGAKQSMALSYLPYAEERGAVLYANALVDRVVVRGERAIAVRGTFADPDGSGRAPFVLRARRGVLVAASAVQTPGLLARSGVRSAHLGRHFLGHPGSPLVGIFDAPVNMWFGATQGFDADHHRRTGRFKIETIALPPELAATRMPDVGARWLSGIADLSHAAVWAVQLRARAEGTVGEGLLGTEVRYDLGDDDMVDLRKGLRFVAELLFAAGAREIVLGIAGLPERIRSPDEARILEDGPATPAAYSFILSHMFGTARMSVRPEAGVVGTDFAVHGTRNLYVVDSSVFPTNLGVNPQEAIMGVAWLAAERIVEARV